jgi:hypothetical protein
MSVCSVPHDETGICSPHAPALLHRVLLGYNTGFMRKGNKCIEGCVSANITSHIDSETKIIARNTNLITRRSGGTCGSLVFKALGYKPEGYGFET